VLDCQLGGSLPRYSNFYGISVQLAPLSTLNGAIEVCRYSTFEYNACW